MDNKDKQKNVSNWNRETKIDKTLRGDWIWFDKNGKYHSIYKTKDSTSKGGKKI